MSLNLIKAAEKQYLEVESVNETVRSSLATLSEQSGISVAALTEAITHVLANIAATVSQGKEVQMMNSKSLAAFLAGVDLVASMLPKVNDAQRTNTLRTLTAVNVGPDGLITTDGATIAQLGTKDPSRIQKYTNMVNQYVVSQRSGKPDGDALVKTVRQLQMVVDRAMRGGTPQAAPQPQSPAPMRSNMGAPKI